MTRAESFIAKLSIVVFSLVLVLAAIEAGAAYYLWNVVPEDEFMLLASINQVKARYGDDFFINSQSKSGFRYSPHHYLGYIPTPNLVSAENRNNALGFRGEDFSVDKPDGVYRIVAVGGSTTYSVDVEDYRDSYPQQLGDYLRGSGYDQIEVINAGAGSYTSYQNFMNIQFRALPLQPDLIIVYQGYNDIHARLVYPYSDYKGDNSGYIAPFVTDRIMPDILEYSTALRIIGIRANLTKPHSALEWHRYELAGSSRRDDCLSQWRTGVYPSGIFAEASAMDMLRNNPPIHFERNLESMVALANQHDVNMLLVTFVTSTEFNLPPVASKEYIFGLEQHNDITRAVAERNDTPLLDLAAVYPADRSLFTDGRHMTVEGNRIRAQLIGDFIIAEFLT